MIIYISSKSTFPQTKDNIKPLLRIIHKEIPHSLSIVQLCILLEKYITLFLHIPQNRRRKICPIVLLCLWKVGVRIWRTEWYHVWLVTIDFGTNKLTVFFSVGLEFWHVIRIKYCGLFIPVNLLFEPSCRSVIGVSCSRVLCSISS